MGADIRSSNGLAAHAEPTRGGDARLREPGEAAQELRKVSDRAVIVHFAPNAKGAGIYGVVTEPGPGVLRVRAAITDIDKTVPIARTSTPR